jgi:hypothetical protein
MVSSLVPDVEEENSHARNHKIEKYWEGIGNRKGK